MSVRPIDRRSFLQIGASAVFGALVARSMWSREALAGTPRVTPPRAGAVILLWLNGGPSHVDTFDPKPGRPTGGPFKAIRTRAPAVQLSEHLPLLADRADRLAIVRSMSSKEGNHAR